MLRGTLLAAITIVFATVIFFLVPSEFQDLRNATLFQSSFSNDERPRTLIILNFFQSMPHIPVVAMIPLVAIASSPIILNKTFGYLKGTFARFLLLALALGIALIGPVLQNQGFAYHFMPLWPVAVVFLLFATDHALSIHPPTWLRGGLTSVTILALMLHPSGILGSNAGPPARNDWWAIEGGEEKESGEKLRLRAQEMCDDPLLYLDAGLAAYHAGRTSWTRETYPLAIQRTNPSLIGSELREGALKKLADFPGNCIFLATEWMSEDNRSWLRSFYANLGRDYSAREKFFGSSVTLFVRNEDQSLN